MLFRSKPSDAAEFHLDCGQPRIGNLRRRRECLGFGGVVVRRHAQRGDARVGLALGLAVFAVNHTADVLLREAVPSMPSFQARVTGTSDGVVHVTAHDPESDN